MELSEEEERSTISNVLLGKRMSLVIKKVNVNDFVNKRKHGQLLQVEDYMQFDSSDDELIVSYPISLYHISAAGTSTRRSGRRIKPNTLYNDSVYVHNYVPLNRNSNNSSMYYTPTRELKKVPKPISEAKVCIEKETAFVNSPVKETAFVNSPVKETAFVNSPVKETAFVNSPVKETAFVNSPVKETAFANSPVKETASVLTNVSVNVRKEGPVNESGLEQSIFDSTFSTPLSSNAKKKRNRRVKKTNKTPGSSKKRRVLRDSSPGGLLEDGGTASESASHEVCTRKGYKRRRIDDDDEDSICDDESSSNELARLRDQLQLATPERTTTVVVYADTNDIACTQSIEIQSSEVSPVVPVKDQEEKTDDIKNDSLEEEIDQLLDTDLVLNEEDLLFSHEIDLLADTTPVKDTPPLDSVAMETTTPGTRDVLADALSIGLTSECVLNDVNLLMSCYGNRDGKDSTVSVLQEGNVMETVSDSEGSNVKDHFIFPPLVPTHSDHNDSTNHNDSTMSQSLVTRSSTDTSPPPSSLPETPPFTPLTLNPLPFSSFLASESDKPIQKRLTRSSSRKIQSTSSPKTKTQDVLSFTSPPLPENSSEDCTVSVSVPPTSILTTPNTRSASKSMRVTFAPQRTDLSPLNLVEPIKQFEEYVGYGATPTSAATPTNGNKGGSTELSSDDVTKNSNEKGNRVAINSSNDDCFAVDEDDVISLTAEDTFERISPPPLKTERSKGRIWERLGLGKKPERDSGERKVGGVWDRLEVREGSRERGGVYDKTSTTSLWDRLGDKGGNGFVEEFKKEQVSSWVAQQRQATPPSSYLPPPHCSVNSGGRGLNYAPPPRVTPPRVMPPGLSPSSSNSLDPNMWSQSNKSIHYSSFCPHLSGSDRHMVAKRHFTQLLRLFRSIVNRNFTVAGKAYLSLRDNFSVSFQPSVLVPLLSMCSVQTGGSLAPKPYLVAEKIFDDLSIGGGRHFSSADHLNVLKTQINCHRYSSFMAYYKSIPSLGLSISSEHMKMLLTVIKALGPHYTENISRLFIDAAKCFQGKDLASYIDDVLMSVDRQVLMINANQLLGWLKCNGKMISELSSKTISSLISVFMECGQSVGAIHCLEFSRKSIPSLGGVVGQLVVNVLNNWTSTPSSPSFSNEIKRLMGIIKLMSLEQCSFFSIQDWEMLLSYSIQFDYITMSHWLFETACKLKQLVSKQTQFNLACYFLDQSCVELTSNIIKVFLSPLPPSPYLFQLCEKLNTRPVFTTDLYSIMIALLQANQKPPASCFQWLLTFHNKYEKCYNLLANIVKQASSNKIPLEPYFYKAVLPELRTWGKDGEALTSVYRSLRNLEPSPPDKRKSVDEQKYDDNSNLISSSSGVGSSPSISLESSSPNYPPPANNDDKSKATSLNDSNTTPVNNTATAIKNGDASRNASLCLLIKENGSQGQFGAVAAILSNLPSHAVYSLEILQSTLTALRNGPLKSFQALQQLVTALRKANDNGVLSPHDLWIAGQIGAYLLCQLCQSDSWKEAFYVLHSLHLCGVHYVSVSPPHLLNPAPSSCSVAITAVTCCLKVNKLCAVMQVLNGCKFINYDNEEEERQRTDLLLDLSDQFLKNGDTGDCFTCLLETLNSVMSKDYDRFTGLTVNAISSWLKEPDKTRSDPVIKIIDFLLKAKLSLPCDLFSHFIYQLISNQTTVNDDTKELISSAVSAGWYHATDSKPQSIVLPCLLTSLEINLILHDHLLRNTLTAQDFEIICPSTLRATVEECLNSDFNPSLSITSRTARPPTSVALLISSLSLSNWYKLEEKNKKKCYKKLICEQVADELKPYCKAKKFKSEDDHIHLVDALCQHFFKFGKESDWRLTDSILTLLQSKIQLVFSTVSCYDSSMLINDLLQKETSSLSLLSNGR